MPGTLETGRTQNEDTTCRQSGISSVIFVEGKGKNSQTKAGNGQNQAKEFRRVQTNSVQNTRGKDEGKERLETKAHMEHEVRANEEGRRT